ncbi:ATP-grasp domain-containing protein [Glycomyces terrestris]|uniref:ATP-grasp domain-containing protein n=1 Tax=Glycomyces terrestris TaxID=2493553 RepID=A0A426V309_9ACTN|nr:ATP-grasp domain-containing protein [Glycomyces terrestris]RRS01231.1 ATP-grasp domain-containing protein [Glycomyces terrestris]
MSRPQERRCVLAFNPKPNILDRLRAKGFDAVAVFPGAAPEYAAPLSALVVDHADADAVVKALDAAGLPVAGALTHSEAALRLADEVAHRLGLPANPARATAASVDKAAMRRLLQEDERFAVAHRVAADRDELAAAIAAHGKVVAKPRDGAGSVGVRVLDAASDLAGITYPVLAEEYLDGPEFSVEALSVDGGHRILGITEKFLFPGTVVESGHLFPARLAPAAAAEVTAHVGDFLDLLGVRLGVTHTEVKLTAKGPKVIETHTRSGGDHIAKLVTLATGVDPIAESVVTATGGAPEFEVRHHSWATAQFRAFPPGTVARVAGVDVARHQPGVNFVESDLAPGVEVRAITSSHDRLLGVVAIGRDPQEALDNANRALDQVRVETA